MKKILIGLTLAIVLTFSSSFSFLAKASTQICNPYIEKIYKDIDEMGYQIRLSSFTTYEFIVTDSKGESIFVYSPPTTDKQEHTFFTSFIKEQDRKNAAHLLVKLGFALDEKILLNKMNQLLNHINWSKDYKVYSKYEGDRRTIIGYNGPGFYFISPAKQEKIMWGNSELKKGQIGRAIIQENTQLYQFIDNKLVKVRELNRGEVYRIYSYKNNEGGLYGLGGGYFVKKKYVKYETPSKSKLAAREAIGSCSNINTNKYKTLFISSGVYNNDPITNQNMYLLYFPVIKNNILNIEVKKGKGQSLVSWNEFIDAQKYKEITLIRSYKNNGETEYYELSPLSAEYLEAKDSVILIYNLEGESLKSEEELIPLKVPFANTKDDFVFIYQ